MRRLAQLVATLGRSRWAFLWRGKWPLLRAALAASLAVGFAVSLIAGFALLFILMPMLAERMIELWQQAQEILRQRLLGAR